MTGRFPIFTMFTRTYKNENTVHNPIGRPVYGQGFRAQQNTNMAPGYENTIFQAESTRTGISHGQAFGLQYGKTSAQKNGFGNFQENPGPSTSTSARKSDDVSSFRVERPKTNSLGVMGVPKPRAYSSTAVNSNQEMESPKRGRAGESENEKVMVLTGTVERVIKYGKIFRNQFCYYQVIGSVLSIAEGKVNFEKTMLLRDQKGGPILQLTYYSNSTHINIDDFFLGQNLRAFGRMIGPNVMSALSIRGATDQELANLPRMCYISDYAISAICGEAPNA